MFTDLKQFILFRVTPENDKLPIGREGHLINAHLPENWMSFKEAKELSKELGLGVAFVLTEKDPYFCLDIDGCYSPSDNKWTPLALEMGGLLPDCYMELSVSGKGLHIWGKLSAPLPPRRIKNTQEHIELYTEGRFIALGQHLQGDAETDATETVAKIVAKYFGLEKPVPEKYEWTNSPVPEWSGPEDDAELLEKMMRSHSTATVFGGKASFQQLWVADAEALGRAFPSPSGNAYDASSADAALAQRLAFWTGKNCDRILGFMKSSKLAREKWEREDYLATTILKACALQESVYNRGKTKEDGISKKLAGGFVTAAQLPEVFEDCTYIIEEHRVLVPGGSVLKPDQFKVLYGGFKFEVDSQKVTRNAWDAFTLCPSWRPPTADGRCFRPELPPLKIIEDNGRLLVNHYIPVRVSQNRGDVTPFMRLLETTYKDPKDRAFLLAYLAALVQYPGHKFGWAPLLQGPEGNGKTFLTTALSEAIGAKYSHTANAGEFSKSGAKFNAWIEGKLFVAVHDVRIRSDEEMELLKPLMTDEKIEIQGKGRDQYTGDNRANFIFTSNHTDALKLYEGGRRYAPFAAAQQTADDMERDGLTTSFFSDLWDWARGRGAFSGQPSGFSKIAYYLHHYQIPDALNPATVMTRAPKTTVWEQFLLSSAGPAEQEIMEAIAQCRPGFCGGWISSIMLDRLLDERRLSKVVPISSRTPLLKRMGYAPHPMLLNGRAVRDVLPDGGRPRLFAKVGHIINNLDDPHKIVSAYSESQVSARDSAFRVA